MFSFLRYIQVYRVLISHIITIVLQFTCIFVYLVFFCTVLCRVVEMSITKGSNQSDEDDTSVDIPVEKEEDVTENGEPTSQGGPKGLARDKTMSPFDMKQSQSVLPQGLPWRENPMFIRAPFIIGNEFCERLAYYGIATNIVTYLTNQLNYSNSQAASFVNIWSGTCYLTPVLGAYLADAYFGRYWIIFSFSIIYIIGLVGLALSAGISALRPEAGQSPSTGQAAFFWIMMYLIALGTGGIKPNVSTFGADQFDKTDVRHRRLIPSYFNYFYASINCGAILSATVVVNLQTNVSWTVGFAVPAASFAVACAIFVLVCCYACFYSTNWCQHVFPYMHVGVQTVHSLASWRIPLFSNFQNHVRRHQGQKA